jgi:protein-ribulosamine 3-kinase
VAAVSGGCISPSYRVVLDGGEAVFVKTLPPNGPPGLLAAEAFSLARMRQAGAVRVPAILAQGAGWLALEWLEPTSARPGDWHELGRAVALLHRHTAEAPGWPDDNFIGSLPQSNGEAGGWADFWVQRRLQPQLELAVARLPPATQRGFEELLRELPERLGPAAAEPASLLHGDLWSGNVHMTVAGPALIDPSCSYGHREVDHAMSRLFGGFSGEFYAGYADEWPLLPDTGARVAIYQLYYLLVHVNLFGGSYIASTERTLRAALRG